MGLSTEEITESTAKNPKLRGNLGTLDIVFTVLAYNAPLAVVVAVIPLLIGVGTGLSTPVILLMAAALTLLFAVGFTTMTKFTKNPGAYYAYVTTGLGRPAGLGAAFLAILAYFFFLAGCYMYVGELVKKTTTYFGLTSSIPTWMYSMGVLVLVGAFGYFRVSLSAKVLSTVLIFEIALVFLWEAAIGINPEAVLAPTWLTFDSLGNGSFGIAILFGVSCFAGFEATAVFREEARSPDITVPRATYISILIMAFLFISSSYFLIVSHGPMNVVAAATNDPVGVVTDSFYKALGNVGVSCVQVLMLTSTIASLLSLHNIVSRYIYSLGADAIFPEKFARIHNVHGSPSYASGTLSVFSISVVAAIAYSGVDAYQIYGIFVGMAGYALLLLQVITSIAILMFFMKSKVQAHIFKTLIAPFASLIGLSATVILATINLEILTGNKAASEGLLIFVYMTFVFGFLWAVRLKKSNHRVYLSIGRQAQT